MPVPCMRDIAVQCRWSTDDEDHRLRVPDNVSILHVFQDNRNDQVQKEIRQRSTGNAANNDGMPGENIEGFDMSEALKFIGSITHYRCSMKKKDGMSRIAWVSYNEQIIGICLGDSYTALWFLSGVVGGVKVRNPARCGSRP